MKWLAIVFAGFIIVIFVMADAGVLARYLGFFYLYPYGDKVGHFVLYGLLTFLLDLALFRPVPAQNRRAVAIKSGLILALLIGLEEFSQQYFSNRTFDLVDLAFSYLGVIFFSWLALIASLRNK